MGEYELFTGWGKGGRWFEITACGGVDGIECEVTVLSDGSEEGIEGSKEFGSGGHRLVENTGILSLTDSLLFFLINTSLEISITALGIVTNG